MRTRVLSGEPDAALAGLVKGAKEQALHGLWDAGILVDDARRVATELEHTTLLAGLGHQVVADLCAV